MYFNLFIQKNIVLLLELHSSSRAGLENNAHHVLEKRRHFMLSCISTTKTYVDPIKQEIILWAYIIFCKELLLPIALYKSTAFQRRGLKFNVYPSNLLFLFVLVHPTFLGKKCYPTKKRQQSRNKITDFGCISSLVEDHRDWGTPKLRL
jgi:hypothetical protein